LGPDFGFDDESDDGFFLGAESSAGGFFFGGESVAIVAAP
jgi:hypothetical protein